LNPIPAAVTCDRATTSKLHRRWRRAYDAARACAHSRSAAKEILMNRLQMARLHTPDSNAIVELLTTRQHTHPRDSVRDTMEHATRTLGCCPAAIARAVDWLQMDVNRPVGRLRRSELLQLARSVYRFWRHTAAPVAPVAPVAGAAGAARAATADTPSDHQAREPRARAARSGSKSD
jgi:hypothetical protein